MENQTVRLETFCDGVFAIALTLLIIEIKIPHPVGVQTKNELWKAFAHAWPSWLAFLVSFITILIAWVSHSYAFKLIIKTSPKFIYANGLLLLTIIILPFFTTAVAEYINTDIAQPAITLYCGISLFQSLAWNLVHYTIMHPVSLYKEGIKPEKIKQASRSLRAGLGIYSVTFILSFWFPIVAFILVALSYILWLLLGISLKEERMTN